MGIEGVELIIYLDNEEEVSLSLEPWQVRAVCLLLGLKVELVKEARTMRELSEYATKMSPPHIVTERLLRGIEEAYKNENN